MSHPLEYYFERELRYVRDALSKKYAANHPDAASALKIRDDRIDDPAVQMLIDGFALLNARIASKLDDGKSEVLEGLLNVLYPNYLRPLPSMMIGQFEMGPSRSMQNEGQTFDSGTCLETESVDGEACQFRTCWPVHLLPISLADTRFIAPPFPSTNGRFSLQAVSALRTRISCLSNQMRLADLAWQESLEFFVHESRDDSYQLSEYFCRHLLGVVVCDSTTGAVLAELGSDAVAPVGIETERGILEHEPRSFAGYGMLSDLFVYPQRYSFFKLQAKQLLSRVAASNADLVFLFDRQSQRLESTLSKSPLRLGCCPLINLYEPPTIAFPIDSVATETPVVVDWDRLWKHEVYSVDGVEIFDPLSERTTQLNPIYSQHLGDPTRDTSNIFWTRREYVGKSTTSEVQGSDVFVSMAFLGNAETSHSEHTICRVRVTALNRDLPLRLPSGEGRPRIHLNNTVSGITATSVTSPSRTVRPAAIAHQPQRIVSHLYVNHASLLNAATLRTLLFVYQLVCHDDPREDLARRTIQSLAKLDVQHSTERVVVGGRPAFARGQHAKLRIDSSGLPPGRAYLFATVLARFLSRYGSINSFVRTTAEIDGKEVDFTWNQLGARSVL